MGERNTEEKVLIQYVVQWEIFMDNKTFILVLGIIIEIKI